MAILNLKVAKHLLTLKIWDFFNITVGNSKFGMYFG